MKKSEIKRLQHVVRRSERTITRITKEIENLTMARDKLSFESEEHYILGQAIEGLYEASSHLNIAKNRITYKLSGR